MNLCFVSTLQIDSIFVTFHFIAIQSGVTLLLPMIVCTVHTLYCTYNAYMPLV